ncbi:hypothetical protein FGG08_006791 [Glutinoglossum americanum]|uniref:Mitochondrial transcription factor 1 n=1 Tax=Glutinoglossum americanum TaxID=1670608 RepID=A0A9P8HS00_9PEZI|nr:hypothetical protein FGG08_006791 [Glutinoglossum americanum]
MCKLSEEAKVSGQLAPSLIAYKNCDIIDVNPGNGLWSSTLHGHLKPRTHLLLEPEESYISSLRPLLDKPGSTYRHVPYSGIEWSSYEKIINDGLLPNQEPLEEHDPGYNSTNNTLLFIANLAHHPRRKFGDFKSISQLMIHQLTTAVRTRTIFQRYGLVRMLVWTINAEKNTILPRTVARRGKSTIQAETTCDKIQEVAGAEGGLGRKRRDMALDIASSKRVAMLMEKDGRERATDGATQEGHPKEKQASGETEGGMDLSGRLWWEELKGLEEGYRNKEFTRFVTEECRQWGKTRMLTKDYQRLVHLRTFASSLKKKNTLVDQLLLKEEDREAAEESVMSMEQEQRDEELAKLAESYKEGLSTSSESMQDNFALASDERKALTMDPPLLMWDRRTQEPIIAKPEEFQPQPKQSILRGLNTLAPGAAAYITPLAPSLSDPKRGGRRNLDQLRVRMLTAEMIEEIVVAWENWPFRPSMGELLMKMGIDRATVRERSL